MPRVVFVTYFAPSDIGDGASHRGYQIVWDCGRAVGEQNVAVLSRELWWKAQAKHNSTPPRLLHRQRLRQPLRWLNDRAGNVPWRIKHSLWHLSRVLQPGFVPPWQFCDPGFLSAYEELVRTGPGPVISVIEHVGFRDILRINKRMGVPTIAFPQNIESLDRYCFDFDRKLAVLWQFGDLAAELALLAECDERLFISRVEAALAGGIGLSSRSYPYRPVGRIAERLRRIRRRRRARAKNMSRDAPFLLIGTAAHRTTGDGFRWFFHNVAERGLPPGVTVQVIGKGVDEIAASRSFAPGASVQFRGWVGQQELDALLESTAAVLVPQRTGFGGVTKIAELASAGVPVIASAHAGYAIEVPQGVRLVDDEWQSWCRAMDEAPALGLAAISEPLRNDYQEPSVLQAAILSLAAARQH